MLRPMLFAAALSLSAAAVAPALAQSSTIRIEPRPYYGAVVTLEQGVRVWRPLPPTSHMIINPTGAPVHINVTDVRGTANQASPALAPPVAAGAYAFRGYRGVGFFPGGRGFPRHQLRPGFRPR